MKKALGGNEEADDDDAESTAAGATETKVDNDVSKELSNSKDDKV